MTIRKIKTEIKLSKKQESVLLILCEGDILLDSEDGSLSLEDADKNSYHIRHDTFTILMQNRMILLNGEPSLGIFRYGMSKLAEDYLKKNCPNEIKCFVQ